MSITATPLSETFCRGLNYKSEGLYEEAIAQFKHLLIEDPEHYRARMELGLVYGFVGLFDESIEELRCAVALASDWVEARVNLAKTYCMLGMNDEARVEFLRVLEMDPFNEEAEKNLVFLN